MLSHYLLQNFNNIYFQVQFSMSFPKILSFADVLKKFSRGNTRKTTRRLSFPYFSHYINFRGTTVALVVCRGPGAQSAQTGRTKPVYIDMCAENEADCA